MNVDNILPTNCPKCRRPLLTRQEKSQALQTGRQVVCQHCGFTMAMSPMVYVIGNQEYKSPADLD